MSFGYRDTSRIQLFVKRYGEIFFGVHSGIGDIDCPDPDIEDIVIKINGDLALEMCNSKKKLMEVIGDSLKPYKIPAGQLEIIYLAHPGETVKFPDSWHNL